MAEMFSEPNKILDREVYDARMRPNGYNASDGPTIVNVNLYFRSFEKIDDVKMVRFLINYINSDSYWQEMHYS